MGVNAMSEKILPNCVGRLDPIVEAIREGDKPKAFDLLERECGRLNIKRMAIGEEAAKADAAYHQCVTFGCDMAKESNWHQIRRECGWSGEAVIIDEASDVTKEDIEAISVAVKAPWWPPMIQASFPPKLDAATLPIGTVMVLGGSKWEFTQSRLDFHQFRCAEQNGWWNLLTPELQELIDRGVEFRLPEGGSNANE
jgi:hypothetical protein